MKASVLVAAFLAGLFVGIGLSGKAETWGVGTIGSQHLGGGDFCEVNPGVGLELRSNQTRSLIGVYRNSLREDDGGCRTWSLYAGKSYLPLRFANWRLGGAALAVLGYDSSITPAVALVIAYERQRRGVNLVWFPSKDGDPFQGVIALQLTWAWD